MGFSRQEYWSGLPFPSPGDLPDPGIEPGSPALETNTLPSELSVQFSSVAQSCPTLCDPMDQTMPGLPVHHRLLEFTQNHVHCVGDAIQPVLILCHPLLFLPSIFPASGSFQMSQLFASGGQSIGVSASTSVLPVNTQDWSPLEWTGWILSPRDSQESSPTPQFKSINSLALSFTFLIYFSSIKLPKYTHTYMYVHTRAHIHTNTLH